MTRRSMRTFAQVQAAYPFGNDWVLEWLEQICEGPQGGGREVQVSDLS